jgi:hypothetical protein
MNSWDFIVLAMLLSIVILFIYAAYDWGYKVGISEGYLRGRNIAKALREHEASK